MPYANMPYANVLTLKPEAKALRLKRSRCSTRSCGGAGAVLPGASNRKRSRRLCQTHRATEADRLREAAASKRARRRQLKKSHTQAVWPGVSLTKAGPADPGAVRSACKSVSPAPAVCVVGLPVDDLRVLAQTTQRKLQRCGARSKFLFCRYLVPQERSGTCKNHDRSGTFRAMCFSLFFRNGLGR